MASPRPVRSYLGALANNLLGRLGFASVLSSVEQLNAQINEVEGKAEAVVGPPREANDEEKQPPTQTLKTLNLPRIIVIGDENSGKSTTLERIAMVAVLPRCDGFSSRQPVVLKLRHDPTVSVRTPRICLTIPGVIIPQDKPLAVADVQAHISARMEQIKVSGAGVVMDEEIVVEIFSDGVPNFDLVDLPGLIVVGSEADKTQQCTKKYLDDPQTGAVVCVIDGFLHNLRTCLALRMVENSRPELQKYSIGVFSKSDKVPNPAWEAEGKSGPMALLEDRLRGTAPDAVALKGGYVALKSRSTLGSGAQMGLEEQTQAEYDFFAHCGMSVSGPTPFLMISEEGKTVFSPFGERQLGLRALIQKIDWVICDHLNEKWVPSQIADVNKKRTELNEKLNTFGKPIRELALPNIFKAIENGLASMLTPAAMNTFCAQIQNHWPVVNLDNADIFQRAAAKEVLLTQYLQCVQSTALTDQLIGFVVPMITKCFNDDVKGPMRLQRFSGLRDSFVTAFKDCVHDRQSRFSTEAVALIQPSFQLEPLLNLALLPQALTALFTSAVLFPTVKAVNNVLPFCVVAKKSVEGEPVDDDMLPRAACETKLRHLSEVETTLQQLLTLAAAASTPAQPAQAPVMHV